MIKPTWQCSNLHFHFVTFQRRSHHSSDSWAKTCPSRLQLGAVVVPHLLKETQLCRKKSGVSATLLFPTQDTTPLAPEAPDPPNEVLVFRRTEPSKSWLSAHLLYSRMQRYYSIYDWRANFLKHFWRPRWRMQMQSQWNGSYMLLFLKSAFMQPLANMLGLRAFKESKHTLTHQRECMSKGIWVWENLWMCVWRGIYMASVRLHVRAFHKHTDFTGAHMSLYLCVSVALYLALHSLPSESSEVQIWQEFCGSFCSKQHRKGSRLWSKLENKPRKRHRIILAIKNRLIN